MRVLTAAEMKQAEEAAVLAGASFEQLMETAGAKSAAEMLRLADENELAHTALLLCGKGNNAGDAFVAARHLAKVGWQVQVLPLLGEEKMSILAKHNLLALPDEVQKVTPETADYTAAFIVDGVFGTGFAGKQLPPQVAEAFRTANAAAATRVALDIPSGLVCDTGAVAPGTFHAHYTLTFGAYKPGLLVSGNQSYTGQVILVDIGL